MTSLTNSDSLDRDLILSKAIFVEIMLTGSGWILSLTNGKIHLKSPVCPKEVRSKDHMPFTKANISYVGPYSPFQKSTTLYFLKYEIIFLAFFVHSSSNGPQTLSNLSPLIPVCFIQIFQSVTKLSSNRNSFICQHDS